MACWHKRGFAIFQGVVLGLLFSIASPSSPAWAIEVDDIARNITTSSQDLPGLLSGFSYLLALVFGVTGILKLHEHVNNPNQVPLRTPMIRFIIGGALLALPIIYETMTNAINAGTPTTFDPSTTAGAAVFAIFGRVAGIIPMMNLNNVLSNIKDSVEDVPGLLSAAAYLLGVLLGVIGLLKIKEHVENPDQTPLREGVVRLLAGGALFAIPTVFDAMQTTIAGGGGGMWGNVASIIAAAGTFWSGYARNVCNPAGGIIAGVLGNGPTMGNAVCGILLHTGAFPAFLTAVAYVIGIVLGFWGILKVKAHVLNPSQTSIWEGIARFIAGGAFFALPIVVEVMRNTMDPATLMPFGFAPVIRGYNEANIACDATGGLDISLYCFMKDMLAPVHVVLNFFSMCAGTVLIMIGISRLLKSAQDGPRAPGGFGTIMTFAAGGALISYNDLMRAFTQSLSMGMFGALPITRTYAELQYTTGMTAAETQHAHTVISAILKFMIIVGLISFVRGIFIIRSVAEGNGQASLMAGVTHMVGGALAVNLGPLIQAVEATLGITNFGIRFT
ncbi:MAG: hypothetical protein IT558_01950 [Alphaproteobacteria bacterium]|nr:hypothetical protein [Alphaproteobacteria bacterium]